MYLTVRLHGTESYRNNVFDAVLCIENEPQQHSHQQSVESYIHFLLIQAVNVPPDRFLVEVVGDSPSTSSVALWRRSETITIAQPFLFLSDTSNLSLTHGGRLCCSSKNTGRNSCPLCLTFEVTINATNHLFRLTSKSLAFSEHFVFRGIST